MPTNIRIYTIPRCGYCSRAKALLNRKGLSYTEIPCVSANDLPKGLTTFPQIYFGPRLVGGCDELYRLDAQGAL